MKVLIIQPWISYRGAESVSLDEAQGLIKLGHEAKILCLYADKKRLKKNDLDIGFILPPKFISRFCQRSNIFFFLFGFFILVILLFLEGRKYDVYNPHNFPSLWVAILIAFFYKKPVFWTVHNFPQHGFTNPMVSRLWELMIFNLDQYITRGVTGIICVSEKVKQQVYKTYKKTASVLYPPVDIPFFAKRNDMKKNLIKGKVSPMILIPSKLHEVKNLELVLKAIRLFSIKDSKTIFIFAGEGSMLRKLKVFSRENHIEKQVKFEGFVKKEKLRDFYRKASFIFLPGSYGEGFNIVVLEALCSGTPSLVMKGSGVDDWIKSNNIGFVVDSSAEKIAEKFHELLKKPEKTKKIGNKGKKIVENYSPQRYVEEIIRIFRS